MAADLEKYASDLDVILRLSRAMGGERELNKLLDLILAAGKELTAADRCSCFVVDDESGELLTRVAQGAATIRLPRGSGIAGTVAETSQLVNIPDVYQDDRFNPENDRRTGYKTTSMLCMPLIGHEDKVVGVLQALNKNGSEPFTDYDERILHLLCSHAAVAVEAAQFLIRDRERQRLVRDMEVARSIQSSLLPDDPPAVSGWRFASWQRPCDATGGDYHDYIAHADGVDLVVGDVSGHGIGAAMYMSTARAFIRALHGTMAPDELVGRMNDLLEEDMSDDSFMTLISARLTPDGGISYVSAGHEPPMVFRTAAGAFDEDGDTGLLLGALPGSTYEQVAMPALLPGDVAVLYTDGIFEAPNAEEEEFGFDRFRSVVAEQAGNGPHAIVSAVVQAVSDWVGDAPVADDWTIMVAERCA